jgi:hypothetical protein
MWVVPNLGGQSLVVNKPNLFSFPKKEDGKCMICVTCLRTDGDKKKKLVWEILNKGKGKVLNTKKNWGMKTKHLRYAHTARLVIYTHITYTHTHTPLTLFPNYTYMLISNTCADKMKITNK